MLNKIFDLQKQYINYYFSKLDIENAKLLLHQLLGCKGTLFFTGVGKSGFIAQKIAATIVSTGTKALYIPPLDALHGDLGIVEKEDVFILLSKSGETEELIDLIPFVKQRGVKTVALTSNLESTLAVDADFHMHLPLERELCPFDLAPTTSMNIQLLFGDLLTVSLMKAKNFSLSAYAKNHPSGRIGKRAHITVEDLMIFGKDVPIVSEHISLFEAVVVLTDKRCGCVLVISDGEDLMGILTDGDLSRLLKDLGERTFKKSISEFMTGTPRSILKEVMAYDALQQMEERPLNPITVLPVVDSKGKVEGLIRMHDILQQGIR